MKQRVKIVTRKNGLGEDIEIYYPQYKNFLFWHNYEEFYLGCATFFTVVCSTYHEAFNYCQEKRKAWEKERAVNKKVKHIKL